MNIKKIDIEIKSTNLNNILIFLKKSKRKARDGKTNGLYKYFTSSKIQSKYIDEFDFDDECIIFGMHKCFYKVLVKTCLLRERF